MARPLRIQLPDAWYHVVNRGNRRADLFLTDADRTYFLSLVAELPQRFGIEVHAFVLMENHYHLLLHTSQPNLSQAVGWLNLSYGVSFNRAHRQVGHVFQGRFHADLIEQESSLPEVARYLHLNPVRTTALRLGKAQRVKGRVVTTEDPGEDLLALRLKTLKEYPWSSWRAYSGEDASPAWLETGVIDRAYGGRSRAEQRRALIEYTEAPVREGRHDSPWERRIGGCILGSEDFAERVLAGKPGNPEEQTAARRLKRRISWDAVVEATESILGQKWDEVKDRHGDWTRDAAVYFAVRRGGQRLAEIVRRIGGVKYQAAAQAQRRFAAAAAKDPERKKFLGRLEAKLSNI